MRGRKLLVLIMSAMLAGGGMAVGAPAAQATSRGPDLTLTEERTEITVHHRRDRRHHRDRDHRHHRDRDRRHHRDRGLLLCLDVDGRILDVVVCL